MPRENFFTQSSCTTHKNIVHLSTERHILFQKIPNNKWEEVTKTNGTQKSKESEEGEKGKKEPPPEALNTKKKIPRLIREAGFSFCTSFSIDTYFCVRGSANNNRFFIVGHR